MVFHSFGIFDPFNNIFRILFHCKAPYPAPRTERKRKPGDDMQIEIQARGFTLTQTLRGYLERRLSCALSTRDDRTVSLRARWQTGDSQDLQGLC
jgi:hypothetical protein